MKLIFLIDLSSNREYKWGRSIAHHLVFGFGLVGAPKRSHCAVGWLTFQCNQRHLRSRSLAIIAYSSSSSFYSWTYPCIKLMKYNKLSIWLNSISIKSIIAAGKQKLPDELRFATAFIMDDTFIVFAVAAVGPFELLLRLHLGVDNRWGWRLATWPNHLLLLLRWRCCNWLCCWLILMLDGSGSSSSRGGDDVVNLSHLIIGCWWDEQTFIRPTRHLLGYRVLLCTGNRLLDRLQSPLFRFLFKKSIK